MDLLFKSKLILIRGTKHLPEGLRQYDASCCISYLQAVETITEPLASWEVLRPSKDASCMEQNTVSKAETDQDLVSLLLVTYVLIVWQKHTLEQLVDPQGGYHGLFDVILGLEDANHLRLFRAALNITLVEKSLLRVTLQANGDPISVQRDNVSSHLCIVNHIRDDLEELVSHFQLLLNH